MIDGVASWYRIYWEHAEDMEGATCRYARKDTCRPIHKLTLL